MSEFQADIVIKDGSLLQVRSLRPADKQLVLEFVKGLSEESIYFRFFGAGISKESAVSALINEGAEGFAIIALREQRIVAHAGYYLSSPGTAEIGVIVSDDYRQKGLGTLLVGELAEVASHNGIGTFEAIVVPENYPMIDMLRNLGFPIVQKIEPGSIRITYPTSLLPDALEKFEQRESIATSAAIRHILRPKSIAIIGDSYDENSLGRQLLTNIVEGNFNGNVYAVNFKSDLTQSVQHCSSINNLPENVELAFLTTDAEEVVKDAQECTKKGVSSLIVISSGFAESGAHGTTLQNQLVEVCRNSGTRLVGPNCIGVINTDPSVRLNGQLSSVQPSRGKIGFLSQSGALGIAVIDGASKLGLGISSFISVGNKADISGNDLLQYWETDDNTSLILLYLESFGNPRKFGAITRRVTKRKPILVVKSGRSRAGFRASQSHTGTLVSSSDITVDALFKQAGVIRTETLEEMFDAAALLSTQPLPKGKRIGILTNTGGAATLAADACEALGMGLSEISMETQNLLETSLSVQASGRNPVNLTRTATASDFGKAIRIIAKDPNIDALIVIFIPSISITGHDVANELLKADLELGHSVPVVASFMANRGITSLLSDEQIQVPSYPFPESAARALSHAVSYGEWVRKSVSHVPSYQDARKSEAAAIVAKSLKGGEQWMRREEVDTLLDCYHIPQEEKKVTNKRLTNDSLQMIVGITHDPIFGPVVACGAGGPYVDLLKDVSIRLAPLTEADVDEMLASLKTYPLLTGYRGSAPLDIRALRDIILRVGKLSDEIQEIAEMDLNPIIVYRDGQGAFVSDARIRIGLPSHQTPLGAKR